MRILTENERGWLKLYLRTIMRRAIAHRLDAHQDILAIADEERGRMRKSYQRDDFVELCAELAGRLIHLRHEAEVAGGGKIANSAVLDAKHPDWRDELPLYVPAQDSGLISELLTGLLDEKMSGLTTEGVEARRYLVKHEGQWRPAVQILADGEVPTSRLTSPSMQARLRAVPSGELGNHLAGELALLEPPVGEQRRWRVHPSSRIARLLVDYPFAAPVTVSLTAPEGAPTSWTWPRGDAQRSDVLVFQEDEGSSPDRPLLRLLRAGSVSSPAKILYALIPMEWSVEPGTEGAIAEIEDVPAIACKLGHLAGAAYFRADENEAVRFRIEPNTDGREHELELMTTAGPGFELADRRFELALSPAHRPVARAFAQIDPAVSEIDLDDLRPPPGAQLIEVGTELDCDLATFGEQAAKLIVGLLEKCGAWQNARISRITYQDAYVASPLVARLLIETASQLASKSGSTGAELIVETRQPRSEHQRGDPWQLWHDWRDGADQCSVVELFGRQKGLRASFVHKDVPHGRYLKVEYENDARATVVLDQGFGAWAPPRHLRVRHDFDADAAAQARQLAAINAVLQRKGSGATYLVAMSGG